MHIEKFFTHHGLAENPFAAEEARHDNVFERLKDTTASHPDFPKILGRLDQPSTAVVFGEKGSGKTAIRLMIGERVVEFNEANPGQRTLLVAYDDLNPFLDRIIQHRRKRLGKRKSAKTGDEKILSDTRLVDHQDAILGVAVTQLVDALLGSPRTGREAMRLPGSGEELARQLPRARRVDIGVLAALYDQPRASAFSTRWRALRKLLKISSPWPRRLLLGAASVTAALGALRLAGSALDATAPAFALPVGIAAAGAAAVLWSLIGARRLRARNLAAKVTREMAAIERDPTELTRALAEFPSADLAGMPWPLEGVHDSRYQLTNRLIEVLHAFGYAGILVLVDRVDEPSVISGRVGRMRSIVWPLLDHKFLQQDRVGVKLLLPVELRHILHRESSDFFQEARLDKQNLVDRLSWSGATLYDVCTHRLRACRAEDAEGEISLTDLFDAAVTREMLVDALDQMHQPRDAFKFLYHAVMEHCRSVPDDEPVYRIHRLTLDAARREQAQRIQDLARGYSPA